MRFFTCLTKMLDLSDLLTDAQLHHSLCIIDLGSPEATWRLLVYFTPESFYQLWKNFRYVT